MGKQIERRRDVVMVKRVIEGARHRNGVSGAPFDVLMFDDAKTSEVLLGVVFEEPGHVAVLSMRLLELGVIEFGPNSWRGDDYEPELRAWIAKRDSWAPIEAVRLVTCDDCRRQYPGPTYYTLGTGYADGDGVVAGVFGSGGPGLVHASDRSECTGSLCPRCAGPDLEPDVAGDPRRPRPARGALRATLGTVGPGHAAAVTPARAYAVTEGRESWLSCLKCLEDAGRPESNWKPVDEDGTFGVRACETCGAQIAGR